jgi:hypothetical protein
VVNSPSLELGGSSKDHPVTVFTSYDTLSGLDRYTTCLDLPELAIIGSDVWCRPQARALVWPDAP